MLLEDDKTVLVYGGYLAELRLRNDEVMISYYNIVVAPKVDDAK